MNPIGARIVRNAALLSAANLFCKILQFGFFIVLIRQMSKAEFGAFNTFGEAALIMVVLSDMGIDNLLVRELSRRRDRPHPLVQQLLGLRLSLVAAGLALLALVLYAIRPEGQGGLIGLACFYGLLVALLAYVRGILRAYEAMGREAVLNVLDKLTHVALGIALLLLGYGVGGLLLALCAGSGLALALGGVWAARICPGCFRPRRGDWRPLLAVVWPFALVAICVALLHRQDTVMISALRLDGDAEAGRYNYAYRLLEGLFLLPQILALASYPAFSLMHQARLDLRARLFPFLRMLAALAAPIVVGGILVGPGVLALIRPEAMVAADPLRLLLLSYPFICGNFMLGTVLASTDRQHRNFIAGAVALAVNTALNLATIPRYGAMGAALATVLSQAAYFFVMLHYCRDLLTGWSADAGYYLKALAAALLMGAAVQLLAAAALPVLAQIAAGAFIYAVLAGALSVLSWRDLAGVWRQARGATPLVEVEE